MTNNKVKIGNFELTKMPESQNDHYDIKDGRMFCNGEFVAYCEGCDTKIYKQGVLVIANDSVDEKFDDGSTSYTFFNNNGDSVFYAQNYDVIGVDADNVYHEVNTSIDIDFYEEMLIASVFDGQNHVAHAVDYTSGKGFCGDRVADVCADIMLFKDEKDLSL